MKHHQKAGVIWVVVLFFGLNGCAKEVEPEVPYEHPDEKKPILINENETDRLLQGEVSVTEEKGKVVLSYIFLDEKGAVRGVVLDRPKTVQAYQEIVETKISENMIANVHEVVSIQVHIK